MDLNYKYSLQWVDHARGGPQILTICTMLRSSSKGTERSLLASDDFLRRFDIFPKVEADMEIKSSSGGFISLMCFGLIIFLLGAEVREYLKYTVHDRIAVDPVVSERLQINLDITFSALSCAQTELVLMDVTGEHQVGVDHSISKRSILSVHTESCGDCFGAGDEGSCCNSCSELVFAYVAQGWDASDIIKTASQCDGKINMSIDDILSDISNNNHGGCNIKGSVKVNKVSGNFHVALGHSKSVQGRLVHQFPPAMIDYFNSSHIIHSLWFGNERQDGTLDGTEQFVNPHASSTAVYQYFIQIQPIESERNRFYQYTATKRFIPIGESSNHEPHHGHGHSHPAIINSIPGIFFIYDFSAFTVHRTDRSVYLLDFLTNVLAIIGGLVALISLLGKILL